MKINVCSVDFGEIRQFEHEDFLKTLRKVKYLEKRICKNGTFFYEIDFESHIKTFEDFTSFKNALKEVCK